MLTFSVFAPNRRGWECIDGLVCVRRMSYNAVWMSFFVSLHVYFLCISTRSDTDCRSCTCVGVLFFRHIFASRNIKRRGKNIVSFIPHVRLVCDYLPARTTAGIQTVEKYVRDSFVRAQNFGTRFFLRSLAPLKLYFWQPVRWMCVVPIRANFQWIIPSNGAQRVCMQRRHQQHEITETLDVII